MPGTGAFDASPSGCRKYCRAAVRTTIVSWAALGLAPAAIREVVAGALGGWFVVAPFVLAIVLLVVVPYVAFERRFRDGWTKTRTRTVVAGGGSPYRRGPIVAGAVPGAPWFVRAAALTSFSIGQAWLPLASLLAVAVIDAPYVGIGVAMFGVPLVLVLARTWWAGARLLRPDAPSQRAARDAARWLVHVMLPAALASVPLLGYLALRADETPKDGFWLVVACAAGSCVALAHAAFVGRATALAATFLPPAQEREVRATPPLPVWLTRLLERRR